MFFATSRPGSCAGSADIWVSRRHDRRDDFGWESPVHLACDPEGPNSASPESGPTVIEDETGTEVLFFNSARPGGPGTGNGDIYQSRMKNDDTFGPATLVAELSTTFGDLAPAVGHDGLEVIFTSNRPGAVGGAGDWDLWMATRSSTADLWSAPVNVTVLNSPLYDGGKMSFSFDGLQLYFRSHRAGQYGNGDLYVATREKLRGK